MWKTVKITGVVLVVLIAALLAAPFLININNYRQEISSQIEQATGRHFTIGSIHASLFPWIGLELKDVRMANALGFSSPDFLRAETLQIQLEVMPLLHKEIVIRRFELIKPEIYLARNSHGEGNWQDLTGTSAPIVAPPISAIPSTSSATRAPSHAGVFSLAAQSMVIQQGRISWRDSQGGGPNKGIDISDLNLTITDLQQTRPVKVSLSARIANDQIKLEGEVGPLGDLGQLDPTHLPLQLHLSAAHLALSDFQAFTGALPATLGTSPAISMDLHLEQRPDGIRVTTGKAVLHGEAPAPFQQLALHWKCEINAANQIQLRSLDITIDQTKLITASGTITKLKSDPSFALRIQSAALTRKWLARFAPILTTLYAGHSTPWKQLRFGALLRGNSQQIRAEDLQLVVDHETLQGDGSIRFGDHPVARLNLSGATLHLDPWLPQPKPAATTTVVATPPATPATATAANTVTASPPAASAEPDLRAFAKWQVDLRLSLDKLNMRRLDLTHFRVVLTGKKGDYQLKPLSFALAGGTVQEQATLNINHYPAKWDESVTVQGVEVQPILQALGNTDLLSGSLAMQTELHGSGVLPDQATSHLNGKGNLALTNGSVKGFDIAATMRNLTAFKQQGKAQQTDFSQLTASYTITNGVVKNKDLFMESPLFRLTGHGSVNLAKKTLNYHVKPKLVGTLIGQGDTMAVRKGLSVPLGISGSFNHPKIRPEIDTATLINSISTLLKGNGKPGGGAADALIGSRLGGGNPPAATGATTPAPTPQQKLQGALKSLFQGL
ncbi:MAG: AsmA family protein [Mariprofundales bacterium]|nr:AsmA family protein [Mariprofundales bacterium]